MNVHQIPARTDNYIYLITSPHLDHCVAIDATDFSKIDHFCQTQQKKLSAILITHHHEDHIFAIKDLTQKYQCKVYGFQKEASRIPGLTHFVEQGDSISVGADTVRVLETPGHTLGHVSYFFENQNWLFCGDVLFRFGCGRLFEGTPEMMLNTLKKIAALPRSTLVYCAHEYTLTNLNFCVDLEKNNTELVTLKLELEKQRQKNQPTVPFTLDEQLKWSPFLRWDDGALKACLQNSEASDLETFTEVRRRRNLWR